MTYYAETVEMVLSIPNDRMGNHSQCTLQLIKTYYVKTPEIGLSFLIRGITKTFSVRHEDHDEFLY